MIESVQVGGGKEHVVMIHDWSCDHTSYDAFKLYADKEHFTYHFVDLRGYGLSKEIEGPYDLDQAYQDVHDYIKAHFTEGQKVHLVGHSMSTLIVQKFLEKDTSNLKSATVVCAVPACGMDAPQDAIDFMTAVAKGNIEMAMTALSMMTGDRLGKAWASRRATNWFIVSKEQARLDYMDMFVNANFADALIKDGDQTLPFMVISGKNDVEGHKMDLMQETLLKWFPNAKSVEIENAGHYPMEETAPYFANIINQFHIEAS